MIISWSIQNYKLVYFIMIISRSTQSYKLFHFIMFNLKTIN